jgi:hypothetical protein
VAVAQSQFDPLEPRPMPLVPPNPQTPPGRPFVPVPQMPQMPIPSAPAPLAPSGVVSATANFEPAVLKLMQFGDYLV